jgi:hypothetical protein
MVARRGSAIVLAMLLLVLLCAAGMFAVSLPVPVGDGSDLHHQSAVARNMARAGAHAAVARLPYAFADPAPYVRTIPVGSRTTGRYAVVSRRIAAGGASPGSGKEPGFEDYALVSEGSVIGAAGGAFRVRAEIRFRRSPATFPSARILKWEESGPL